MKKIAALLLACIVLVSCGDEALSPNCKDEQEGDTRCNDLWLERCTAGEWNVAIDCGAKNKRCVDDTWCTATDERVSDCDHVNMDVAWDVAVRTDDLVEYRALSSKGHPFDKILFQSFQQEPYFGPTGPGSYVLAGADYLDCSLCLLGMRDCDAGGTCESVFYANEGMVEIESMDEERFAARFVGVRFREVTFDAEYNADPVAGGDLWCANDWEVEYVDQPTADACVPNGTGVTIGSNIADFSLQNCDGEQVSLHDACGSKAVWIILAAGWCSACRSYVPQAVASYEELSSDGLELYVILGENMQGEAPSLLDCRSAATLYGMPPERMLVDPSWRSTFNYIHPYLGDSIGLPWNAVLAGSNMEYVYSDSTGGDLETVLNDLLR